MIKPRFHIADYIVFSIFLLTSLGIGIYFSFADQRKRNTSEYLLAGQKLKVIPVAVSIFVTYTSAITILGAPVEVYSFGADFWLLCIGTSCGMLVAAFLFVPLFHRLKITSINAYLEMRFESKACRLLASVLGIGTSLLWMGLAMLAPSLAFHTATGLPTWAIIMVTALITTIYTSLGGIKAVVWTDTFQGIILFIGLLTIMIKAVIDAGGLGEVVRVGVEHGRIKYPNFSLDPRERNTVWSLVVGLTPLAAVIYGATQSSVQRMISLPTPKKATRAMLLNIPALIVNHSFIVLIGMAIFAVYAKKECDIVISKTISNPNEILPYYVIDQLSHLYGFGGVFMAVLYAGALSSMSSGLNSLAAVVWDDYFRPTIGSKVTEHVATSIQKTIVFVSGFLATGLSIAALHMDGTIIQISFMLLGCFAGPVIGMFCLGMFFPWANWKGCFFGSFFGYIMPIWITMGKFVRKFYGELLPPFSTAGCNAPASFLNGSMSNYTATTYGYNTTLLSSIAPPPSYFDKGSGLDNLYKVSYLYNGLIGMFGTIFFGLIISFATGATDPKTVDAKYIIPIFDQLCCCLPARMLRVLHCGVSYDQLDADKEEQDQKIEPQEPTKCVDHNLNAETLKANHPSAIPLIPKETESKFEV